MKILMFRVEKEWFPVLTQSEECPTPIFVCLSSHLLIDEEEWIRDYKRRNAAQDVEFKFVTLQLKTTVSYFK